MKVFLPSLVVGVLSQSPAKGPIENVVSLLQEMQGEAEASLSAAIVDNEKNMSELTNMINEDTQDIEEADTAANAAKAASEAAQAEIEKLTGEIADHDAEIITQRDNLKALKLTRSADNTAYKKDLLDAQKGLAACDMLITKLKEVGDKSTSVTFLQEQLMSIPKASSARALLQSVAEFKGEQPQVIYKRDDKFHAIVSLVEDLRDELDNDLQEKNNQEASQVANYDMSVNSANKTIENEKDALSKAKSKRAKNKGKKADEDEKEADQLAAKEASQKSLENNKTTKSDDEETHKNGVAGRDSEIAAIKQAIEILSKHKATTRAGGNLLQATSLLQVKRSVGEDSKAKVIEFLRRRAAAIHSSVLLTITEVATADPFAKVIGLIKSLVDKLKQEQIEAQTKFEHCDKIMSENAESIKTSQTALDELAVEIDDHNATIDTETANYDAAAEKVTQYQEDQAKRTETFLANEKQLEEEIATGKATHEALTSALQALSDGHDDAQNAGKGFGGTDGLGTIIDMLQNIKERQGAANDGADKELKTKTVEHEDFVYNNELKEKKQQKNKEDADLAKAQAEEKLADAVKDKKAEDDTMSRLLEEKRANEALCVAKGASHAENSEKRKAEIQSLEDALEILQNSN